MRESQRDIKDHSNNKVIINFGKPTFTITSYSDIPKMTINGTPY